MPLATMVTKHVTNPRKIIISSAIFGLIFFLLFTLLALIFTWHHRSASYDQLARSSQHYLNSIFDGLEKTIQPLQDFTQSSCSRISSDLTQRAAFGANIRAILLVRNNAAFCSSATGNMWVNINDISPETNTDNAIDIRLTAQTPMVKNKPAIIFWVKNPRNAQSGVMATLNINLTPYLLLAARAQQIDSMAIVAGNKAITTWNDNLIDKAQLPAKALRRVTIPGYPVTFNIYGEALSSRDLHLILVTALLLSLLMSSVWYLLMTLRLQPGKEIMLGIKRGEFHVEYQPVIEAASGRVYAVEALMRWTHPTEGAIPPDSFISFAEGQNLMVPLTRHLFRLIASDAEKLRQLLPAGSKISINVSPSHLTAKSFCQDVGHWLATMPARHFDYVFEITERTMVSEDNAEEIFDWIHRQGIEIAIDDFGTGHSALIYLEKFKFDYLKIDRGFVQSIGMETVTSPVLDAMLNLARKLNMNTVAEGVETSDQAAWLLERGVTYMQGYLFSKPCTIGQLSEKLPLSIPQITPSSSPIS
ncbi:phage resistance protein [Erwinia sp. OLTSP20]|uniref:cyclic di-GMP phosphodiesterase n=1 Tax=unclassified Erwinia TaxID=2622719 RepID=UPI000C196DEB|nr:MULTISPECIES: cyclic di-GMP phosphodiesterase [unclassified Erwinia]PIJ49450.1 phage resistance protein [Erwinia sp. OAMSP11]PIJ68981.1 phage resistance protein [Erwinia sp. OLSSP12]PIJ80981.1 phage resistance protein [Erwinia sp. OLMTSP26]PIJ83384.1 phage resistance protein [Erwinia sp. OLMDSP33]PIJ84297.1 phage resistance protein [Erwinia sp. OLCASP19]